VAGQTFATNQEYRAALAVATQGRRAVDNATGDLIWALREVRNHLSRVQAAADAQSRLARWTAWFAKSVD
jgi:hypothetical protein